MGTGEAPSPQLTKKQRPLHTCGRWEWAHPEKGRQEAGESSMARGQGERPHPEASHEAPALLQPSLVRTLPGPPLLPPKESQRLYPAGPRGQRVLEDSWSWPAPPPRVLSEGSQRATLLPPSPSGGPVKSPERLRLSRAAAAAACQGSIRSGPGKALAALPGFLGGHRQPWRGAWLRRGGQGWVFVMLVHSSCPEPLNASVTLRSTGNSAPARAPSTLLSPLPSQLCKRA